MPIREVLALSPTDTAPSQKYLRQSRFDLILVPNMKNISSILISAVILTAAGCASYNAGRLPSTDVSTFEKMQDQSGLKVAVKFLDARESKRIFGVDKVAERYQPVYISIDNRTKSAYEFRKRDLNKPSVPAEEVAKACGFSTVGRATAYGVAGIFIWPLLVPAVVDGVGSSSANQKMQADFMYKEIQDGRIQVNGLLNGVVFFDKMKEGEELAIRLQELDTNEIKLFSFKR